VTEAERCALADWLENSVLPADASILHRGRDADSAEVGHRFR
jgi:hypothetical protein